LEVIIAASQLHITEQEHRLFAVSALQEATEIVPRHSNKGLHARFDGESIHDDHRS
jgi:hypothetical protein